MTWWWPPNISKLGEKGWANIFTYQMAFSYFLFFLECQNCVYHFNPNLKSSNFAAFSNILSETFVPNLVSITRPSLQILGKTQVGISDFQISGQSLIKENCHNSRTSDDTDMKLGPVTKPDNRNKTTSQNADDEVMSRNCDIIVIFQIFGQFGADRVCKSYAFSNSNLLSYKNWKYN